MLRPEEYLEDSDFDSSIASASSTSESNDIKDRIQYHTKLNIKRQLEQLGYDNDVPDDVLEEFIVSMKEQENTQQEDEIDQELLDSNSLIDVIQIKELSQEKSNELAEHLNLKKKYKNSNRVVDVIKGKKSESIQKLGLQ
jgi:hypothetical protein